MNIDFKTELKRVLIYFSIFSLSYFIYKISMSLVLILICIFLANILNPYVSYISSKLRIKRSFACVIILSTSIFLLFSLIVSTLPIIVSKIIDSIFFIKNNSTTLNTKIIQTTLDFINKFPQLNPLKQLLSSEYSKGIFDNLFEFLIQSINIICIIGIIPIITFLFLNNWKRLWYFLFSIMPKKYTHRVSIISAKVSTSVRHCFISQIKISIYLSILYSTLLYISNVNDYLNYGLAMGFASFVPYIGFAFCSFSLIISQFVENQDNLLLLISLIGFGQIIDSTLISPKIFGKTLNIDPSLVFVFIVVFVPVFGIIGAVISMPIISATKAILDYTYFKNVSKRGRYTR